jgi:peptidoglycan/xylan/chitin deacetylase (PgdA/CDA1 family)
MGLAWRMRQQMSPGARRMARKWADHLLKPLGSLSGSDTERPAVALSFDDGPDPEITPRLLDLLDAHDMKATFFLLTERVRRYPDLAREIAARGHEVGLHGDRHDRLTRVPSVELKQRLSQAKSELETAVARPVRYFRPPFGAQSVRTLFAARSCGLDVVVWGPYAGEWIEGTADDVAGRAMQGLHPGSILLLHDGLELPPGETVPKVDRYAAFAVLFERMRGAGLLGTSVGDLIACGLQPRRTAWFRP